MMLPVCGLRQAKGLGYRGIMSFRTRMARATRRGRITKLVPGQPLLPKPGIKFADDQLPRSSEIINYAGEDRQTTMRTSSSSTLREPACPQSELRAVRAGGAARSGSAARERRPCPRDTSLAGSIPGGGT